MLSCLLLVQPNWPTWMHSILKMDLPDGGSPRVVVHNGAVPGTVSQYMSVCHNLHVPKTVDIVFVDYACNDEEMPMPHYNNGVSAAALGGGSFTGCPSATTCAGGGGFRSAGTTGHAPRPGGGGPGRAGVGHRCSNRGGRGVSCLW